MTSTTAKRAPMSATGNKKSTKSVKKPETGTAPVKKKSATRTKIEAAYRLGYESGWNDREKLPKKVGSATAARAGYGQGLKDRKTSDKIAKRRGK